MYESFIDHYEAYYQCHLVDFDYVNLILKYLISNISEIYEVLGVIFQVNFIESMNKNYEPI